MMKKRKNILFLIIKFFVRIFYKKMKIEGLENLPDEPCILVGNHAQANGPIIGELYFSKNTYMWCNSEVMNLKEAPSYAMKDFFPYKHKSVRWFYKLLSYIIAPLCCLIFKNARTIAVYRDSRIISTFKHTVNYLKEGNNIIIFPECSDDYNEIINEFQENFIDVAKLYYKRTNKELMFVPFYNCPSLKKVVIGKPIKFNINNDFKEEKQMVISYFKNEITNIAKQLPAHRVVPYKNISKKEYPMSK